MRALLCPKWKPEGDVDVLSGHVLILCIHLLSVVKSVIVSSDVRLDNILRKSCVSNASSVSGGLPSSSNCSPVYPFGVGWDSGNNAFCMTKMLYIVLDKHLLNFGWSVHCNPVFALLVVGGVMIARNFKSGESWVVW